MTLPLSPTVESRRDFLKKMAAAGSLTLFRLSPLALTSCAAGPDGLVNGAPYRYRTLSLDHFAELRQDIETLKANGQLSDNPTFRSYIDNKTFPVPEDFPEAKSVIVLAVYTPLMRVNFTDKGMTEEILVPPQYYDDGQTLEGIEAMVRNEIVKDPACRIQRAKGVMLKRLAVRSGLARYGKNNITYVDGMGSFLTLFAFVTDKVFEKDNWGDVKMLKACRDCTICKDACPNGCIRDDNFVIDAGRCVTLYNEGPGEFPEWMKPEAHNALMGCMHCQLGCPANAKVFEKAGWLEAVSEEETLRILESDADEALLDLLARKLKGYAGLPDRNGFSILTRNLGVLLR